MKPHEQFAEQVRALLATTTEVLSTRELSERLYPRLPDFESSPQERSRIAKKLARMAPYMTDVATHDGDEVRRFNRVWRRWRWHGTS